MEQVGPGKRYVYSSELLVTDTCAVPNVFQVFSKTNFATLIYSLDNDIMFDFDELTGIFTFNLKGHLQILATLNFGATGVSEVQVSPAFKRDPGAWTFLNARRTELPVIGQNSAFMSGSVDIEKGDQMRFEVTATNALAKFETQILSNASQIPAAVLDFILFIR